MPQNFRNRFMPRLHGKLRRRPENAWQRSAWCYF